MDKLKVYIDFEAISMPFSREIKIDKDFPFAYTLGIYVGKKLKVRTFIFSFIREDIARIHDYLRINITRDIRTLLKDNTFKINPTTVEFIGWAPHLEKTILNNVYKSVPVIDLNEGQDVSLSRITPDIKDNYFPELRKLVEQNLDKEFIITRGLNQDGALAALAGYLLYCQGKNNKEGKYYFDFDPAVMIKELTMYSQDDVYRMGFIVENPELFAQRKKEFFIDLEKKNALIKQISKTRKTIDNLNALNPQDTVEVSIKKVNKDLKVLESELEKINSKFANK